LCHIFQIWHNFDVSDPDSWNIPPAVKNAAAAGMFVWQGKLRLDTFLAEQLPTVSRAKISASIKAGLITVNKTAVNKPARTVKGGDVISVSLLPPEPCTVRRAPFLKPHL
jgi:23S rRNA-/tRNA-specific pseudouridylate synthase